MKCIVLGGGRVGSAIARDLAADQAVKVTVADHSAQCLAGYESTPPIRTIQADLSQPAVVTQLCREFDVVVGAVPGFMGFEVVRAALEAARPVVDISFFPQDPFLLDDLAKAKGVSCLVDFGIAPGCSNLLFGHAASWFQRINRFCCYVGGLPVERRWPWEYKAPFSPVDVLEEYTRPGRYIADGKVVTKPALSDPELIDFPEIGTVEAFLTDGLRTLLRVPGVEQMVEKTCRYPGHREKILALRDSGFLSQQPQTIGGACIAPFDLTAQLLFSAWQLHPGEHDLTAMRVCVEGLGPEGTLIEKTWDLLDRYDSQTQTTSMARTTGYTCTAGVQLIAQGHWKIPGVAAPESVGQCSTCYQSVLQHLGQRGIIFAEKTRQIAD